MNGRDIESILAEHGGLRRSFKNLESSVKSCNKNAVLQMLSILMIGKLSARKLEI